jgi:hypothetical protein
MQNKHEQAKAALTNARRGLAHAEKLVRRKAIAGASADDLQAHKEKARQLAAEVDELEGIVARSLIASVGGRGAKALRAIDDWKAFKRDNIVIPALDNVDADDVDDKRLMDLGAEAISAGVSLVWSDELQSVVAFAFKRTVWTESEARQYVEDAQVTEQAEVKTWGA